MQIIHKFKNIRKETIVVLGKDKIAKKMLIISPNNESCKVIEIE